MRIYKVTQTTQTTQTTGEPSANNQLSLIISEFPFINDIILAIQQNNLQQAQKIAYQNGINWQQVQQSLGMINQAGNRRNLHMIKNAGLFSWFANLGNKGQKGAAGIALALVLMGLAGNVSVAEGSEIGSQQGQQGQQIEQSIDSGNEGFQFNNVSANQLGKLNSEQLQSLEGELEKSIQMAQQSLDQLQNQIDQGNQSPTMSKIQHSKANLLEKSINHETNLLEAVRSQLTSLNQQPPNSNTTNAPSGISGQGLEGVL